MSRRAAIPAAVILLALVAAAARSRAAPDIPLTLGSEAFRFPFVLTDVAFSPDGARVAVIGEYGSAIVDPASGRQVFLDTRVGGHRVAWSPSGRSLAITGPNRGTMVLDAASGEPVAGFTRPGRARKLPGRAAPLYTAPMTKKWTAEEVLALGRSFQPACILSAAADLDLFGAIDKGAATPDEIARRVRGKKRGVTILLDALAALSLLDKRGDRYAVPPSLRRLLVADHPESLLAMTQHQANCLRRWAQLARTIRDGKPAEVAPSVRGEDGDRASFIEAMDNISRAAAPALVAELMPIRFTRLLDIGGGSGTWTIAWLRANGEARAILFDLPSVVPLARQRLERAGLLDRVDLVAGDFYEDPLPGGADLALLSAIVHQNSRRENRALFRKAFAALVVGGRLLIRDVVMDGTRTKPPAGALFAVNMLSATEGGGTFTLDELREDLAAAGFANVKQLRRDEWMHSVVSAVRPKSGRRPARR
jgi:hypothetical protein